MKKFCCVFCAALAVAAVMGGDDSAREAEEYYEKGHDYFKKMDMEKAFKSYRRAAALGNAKALFQMGAFYRGGWQIDRDPELAKKYFMEAEPGLLKLAEKNDAEARLIIADMGLKSNDVEYWLERAVESFRAAAARGDANAMIQLGILCESSKGGVNDPTEAMRWYRRAAEQGNPEAEYCIGVLYEKGIGVKSNHSEALKWYRRASAHEFSLAEVAIGELYEHEKKDLAEALKWYRRAAAHGNKYAEFLLRQRNEPLEEPPKPKPATSTDRR